MSPSAVNPAEAAQAEGLLPHPQPRTMFGKMTDGLFGWALDLPSKVHRQPPV